MTGEADRASPVESLRDQSDETNDRTAVGTIGAAMITEANQAEERVGRIVMRVAPSGQPTDDLRRLARAEALARWLLDEWRAWSSMPKERAA